MVKRATSKAAPELPAVTIVIEWENAIDVEDKWTAVAMAALEREIIEVGPRMAEKPRVMYLYNKATVDPTIIERTLAKVAPRLKEFAKVEVIPTDGLTYYKLKNYGISRAKTDISIMLDSDAAPQPGWLENLLKPFDDPEIMAVAGFTYLAHEDLLSRTMALSWIFDLPDEGKKTVKRHKMHPNNAAVRTDFFRENPFPDLPAFKKQCGFWLRDITERGYGFVRTDGAQTIHAPHSGPRFVIWRAWTKGTDRDYQLFQTKARSRLGRIGHAAAYSGGHLATAWWRIMTKGRKVDLPVWQRPAAMAIALGFYGVTFAGALTSALTRSFEPLPKKNGAEGSKAEGDRHLGLALNGIARSARRCDTVGMGAVDARFPLERIIRAAFLALAVLFFTTAATAAPPKRIVAVGDLHGDFQAWVDIARAAGLIDSGGHWAGGKTTLIQLGDILDREPDSLKIVRSLQQLQKEAPRAGGKVVVILGNHEAMNLLGDFRYTTPGEFAAFATPNSAALRDRIYDQNRAAIEAAVHATNPALTPQQIRDSWMAQHPLGWVEHKFAWSPSGELGKWAAHNPAIVAIGGTLFVHGGLSAEYAKLPIEEINRRVQVAMATGDNSPTTILYDPLGPLWYRGLVMHDPDAATARAAMKPSPSTLTPDQEVDAVLSAYNAQRLVVGHTPDLKGIELLSQGRLARIDTGNSRAYGGPLSWLEIVGGTMTPHTVARSAP